MSQFRRTLKRALGRTFRGKSHRKQQVRIADLAGNLFPTSQPAFVPIRPPVAHRSPRRRRSAQYATGQGNQTIFRIR